jgi:GNAT superfamily N-acetyltransferase
MPLWSPEVLSEPGGLMTTDRQTIVYTIERLAKLEGEDAAKLAEIQRRSLAMLHASSAIDHVLKEHEVEAFAADERLLKFVIRHDGEFVGVFAVARRPSHGWEHLADAFYETHYPGAMERGKFAYLAGSFVAPEHQGQGAYSAVLQEVYTWIEENQIEAFSGDMAAVNYRWMVPMISRTLKERFGYSKHEDIDTHHFTTYLFDYGDVTIDLRGDDPTIDDSD